MDTKKLPPALLVALGLSGCGNGDDGTATTGPCLDVAPMTGTETATGSESGDESGTTIAPCLDATAPQSTTGSTSGSESGSSSSSSESGSGDSTSTAGSESGEDSTGSMDNGDRDEVVRTLVGRGILPDDVAAKLGKK